MTTMSKFEVMWCAMSCADQKHKNSMSAHADMQC